MAVNRINETEDKANPHNYIEDSKNFAYVCLRRKVSVADGTKGNH